MEAILKGIIFSSLIVATIILTINVWRLVNYQVPKFTGEVQSLEIKQAMNKMGPYYNYMMKGEILYVETGNGKWLRLKY